MMTVWARTALVVARAVTLAPTKAEEEAMRAAIVSEGGEKRKRAG